MFASVTSCLSWNVLEESHWSGPALWYGTIILSLSTIFTGAQQSLVLPDIESIEKLTYEELEKIKNSFTFRGQGSTLPSVASLFAWQLPIMLLGVYCCILHCGFIRGCFKSFGEKSWVERSGEGRQTFLQLDLALLTYHIDCCNVYDHRCLLPDLLGSAFRFRP